ncbi:hypothetical protein FGO68_gene2920 [Halteria grandinella]|uniref:Uncharacterized protein n=1 Tax=Halteria grandinella TaxID=5974 RepID=A0A8J8NP13_HALGN|nr:hypothetical protein FGO68_gene2920 [Halteria grandinella]
MSINQPINNPTHLRNITLEEQFASKFIEEDVPSRPLYSNNLANREIRADTPPKEQDVIYYESVTQKPKVDHSLKGQSIAAFQQNLRVQDPISIEKANPYANLGPEFLAQPGSMVYLGEDQLEAKLASLHANHDLIREIMYQNHPEEEFARHFKKQYQSSPLLVAFKQQGGGSAVNTSRSPNLAKFQVLTTAASMMRSGQGSGGSQILQTLKDKEEYNSYNVRRGSHYIDDDENPKFKHNQFYVPKIDSIDEQIQRQNIQVNGRKLLPQDYQGGYIENEMFNLNHYDITRNVFR